MQSIMQLPGQEPETIAERDALIASMNPRGEPPAVEKDADALEAEIGPVEKVVILRPDWYQF